MKQLVLSTLVGITLVGINTFASDLATGQSRLTPAQKSYRQGSLTSSPMSAIQSARTNSKKHRKNNNDEKSKVEESQTKS